jgi:hypothetical protein
MVCTRRRQIQMDGAQMTNVALLQSNLHCGSRRLSHRVQRDACRCVRANWFVNYLSGAGFREHHTLLYSLCSLVILISIIDCQPWRVCGGGRIFDWIRLQSIVVSNWHQQVSVF